MKALIIYCSDYSKNTEKIARLFAEKTHAELVNVREADDIDTERYDLIGFGSGVYMETLSPKLFSLVKKKNLRGKKVFVFSTSGIGMNFYNNRLKKLLLSKGAINMGSFACKGSFIAHKFTKNKLFGVLSRLSQGHPNVKDFKDAERFIVKVTDSL